ncbi:YcgN family cysteine cluster protein [Kushneria phyllosphaerae]|uniref:UPF0260 protein KSP9073_02627 n=1 Tax=Kushneria phyllosphaerae TaxID=2100822 RepID=A0A2R8CNW3_9GAMM|nr:YcgN family cysteine cluster protein [Kushneria phyllosphaerae]SPJ34586.1 hypothetical protein KSP9073_02627 [Kushneria phyllosphaerae]
MRERFWERFPLEALTPVEWEAICDGCGQCCLVRLEDEENQEIVTLSVACRLFDTTACRCSDYEHRFNKVSDCLQLTPERARAFHWLPDTCGYRRLAQSKPLPKWHPLISGDPQGARRAGVSMHGMAVSEAKVPERDYEDYIIAVIPCQS